MTSESTAGLLEEALSTILFEDVLHARWQKGTADFGLVLGQNATGKSLLRRIIGMEARERKLEFIPLSMEGRTDTMTGVVRGMVYGNEQHDSTGHCSSRLVLTGIRTAMGRDSGHVLFWDEPDVGLSDEYAMGAAQAIVEFVKGKTAHTKAVFVVTHRRAMVEEFAKADPHVVLMGEGGPATLEEWLKRPLKARPLSDLPEEGHKMFGKVLRRLDKIKKSRGEA